jgi:site-specific recombinase XerC
MASGRNVQNGKCVHFALRVPPLRGSRRVQFEADADDFAITARTGEIRLHGKGDEVRSVPLSRRARELVPAWLDVRGRHPGPIWTGQRGPLTISGITQVVLATGADAASRTCDPTDAGTPSPRATK